MRLPRVLRRRLAAPPTPPPYVPHLDAPLWRGTDLPDPVDEDPAPTPARDPGGIAGALLGLAYATDETTARWWLSLLARRGASWEQQREAWDEWLRVHRSNVHYLNTTATDDPEDLL